MCSNNCNYLHVTVFQSESSTIIVPLTHDEAVLTGLKIRFEVSNVKWSFVCFIQVIDDDVGNKYEQGADFWRDMHVDLIDEINESHLYPNLFDLDEIKAAHADFKGRAVKKSVLDSAFAQFEAFVENPKYDPSPYISAVNTDNQLYNNHAVKNLYDILLNIHIVLTKMNKVELTKNQAENYLKLLCTVIDCDWEPRKYDLSYYHVVDQIANLRNMLTGMAGLSIKY